MANRQQSVEQLFGAALDLPLDQRCAFLDEACEKSPELRPVVDELLLDDERAGSFLAGPLIHPGDLSGSADRTLPPESGANHQAALANPARFQPSQIIAERFVVVRFIARGGMGEVYEVQDKLLQGEHVALKIIRPEIAADGGSSHRFEQEVILARKVNHANLCPIYEIFHCEQPAPAFLFLTMKLLHGETLDAFLRRSGALPRNDAVTICRQLISGVAAIHAAGIIHRDLKPNNVMLEHLASGASASIMDFGLARLHESEVTVLKSGTVAGTPGYIAPELLQGGRPTQATDYFALGIVLHQVLTGERPIEARNGVSVLPRPSLDQTGAPADLIGCTKSFLSDDPEQRCRAFEEIRPLGYPDSHASSAMQSRPTLLSRRGFAIAAGASVCALAGGAVWEHNGIYDVLHPLPSKRYVALLDWPPASDARLRPMIMGLIDTMASELARAEAFDHNFFVTAQTHAAEVKSPAELNQVRESLGANLVLAASGSSTPKHLTVSLHVLDPVTGRTLRRTELRTPLDQQFSLPERVVRAAARLLDIHQYDPDDERSQVGTENPEALEAFRAAEALMKQPNDAGVEAAIEKYKIAVEADRQYAIAHARLAKAYLRLYAAHHEPSFITLARANAETAISLNPKCVESHIALGSVSWETGALPDALHEFDIALSLDPSDTRTLTYQAQVSAQLNRWREAESTYKQVIRLRPNWWLPYNELGGTYNAQANYKDALAAYRAASSAAPARALPYNNIAAIYFQLGDFTQALTTIEHCISVAAFSGAYQTFSDILRAQGKYTDALKSALHGAKLDPEDSGNWLEAGDAYSLIPHHTKEAADAYLRAAKAQEKQLQTEPGNGPAWMLLALYRTKIGNTNDTLALLTKAELLGAGDMYSQLTKVRVLELLGRRDEAGTLLRTWMRKGVTSYQVRAIHDLDRLVSDPRFSETATPTSSSP